MKFSTTDFQSVVGGGRGIHSPSIGSFQFFRDDTMQSRMGRTTSGGDSVRPMTAIGGAGFQSQSKASIPPLCNIICRATDFDLIMF